MANYNTSSGNHTFNDEIRVDEIKDNAGTGAPNFPNNLQLNGTTLSVDSGTFNYTDGSSDQWVGSWYQIGRMVTVIYDLNVTSSSSSHTTAISNLSLPAPSTAQKFRAGNVAAGSLNFPTATIVIDATNLTTQKRFDDGTAAAKDIVNTVSCTQCCITYLVD